MSAWPTDEEREAVPEPTRLRIHGTWLACEVDEHTCGTGPDGYYGHHEPGCGLIPEVDLSTLPGWAALVRAERAAALREVAAGFRDNAEKMRARGGYSAGTSAPRHQMCDEVADVLEHEARRMERADAEEWADG